MKKDIICDDTYEAQKLASLIYIKDNKETFIDGILEIIENEIIISLKDKSAHSILLRDRKQAEEFADFIQSVVEESHKIHETLVIVVTNPVRDVGCVIVTQTVTVQLLASFTVTVKLPDDNPLNVPLAWYDPFAFL